jgi:hypothetical protein
MLMMCFLVLICGIVYFFDFSYIVPEYSFLDARGLGAYEGKTLESVSEVLFSFTVLFSLFQLCFMMASSRWRIMSYSLYILS